MSVYVVGISHKTAPLSVRERCAVGPDRIPELIETARKWLGGGEVCLISTCNRTEIYAALHGPPPGREDVEPGDLHAALRTLFIELIPPAAAVPADAIYVLAGEDAVSHVFRVAASLDSLIIGEKQIAGQLKTAMRHAQQATALGPRLQRLLEGALRAARRVFAETALGEGTVSVASVAVEFASKVFSDFSDKAALVIGGGETAQLVVTHVRERGLERFFVANRSFDKACRLAEEVAGTALPFERLADHLPLADIVISTTGASEPVLKAAVVRAALRARRRPMILLDLAVPRDIEPAAGDAEGAFLYDIDDLEGIAAENRAARESELDGAVRIVTAEAAKVIERGELAAELGPVVAAVRRRAQSIVAAEVERLFGRVRDLDDRQREAIEQMTHRVINKLLHTPVSVLKQEARNGRKSDRLQLFSRLFGVDDLSTAEMEQIIDEQRSKRGGSRSDDGERGASASAGESDASASEPGPAPAPAPSTGATPRGAEPRPAS